MNGYVPHGDNKKKGNKSISDWGHTNKQTTMNGSGNVSVAVLCVSLWCAAITYWAKCTYE